MKKELSRKNEKLLNKLASDLNKGKNTIPYNMKRPFNFKGRKSPDIARKAIKALTDKDSVIYDPFMGSGAFLIAAVEAERNIVTTEIDNYTHSVVCSLLYMADLKKLNALFQRVKDSVKSEIMELYATSCCGEKNYISKLYFDPKNNEFFNPIPHRNIVNGKNIELVAKCPVCGSKMKKFSKEDEKKLETISKLDTSKFPKDTYIENSRINITRSTGADRYDRIFTKRNQKALLILQEAILKLPSSPERDIIEHSLVSALSLSRITMYGSSSDILYHVIPYKGQESNVWKIFEDKFKYFVKFKKKNPKVLSENPERNSMYEMHNCSYQDFCGNKNLHEHFDLIYTDFPYTDQVPYLERNQLYRIWLKNFYNKKKFVLTDKMLNDEIVQTNAPSRPDKQGIEQYYKDIDKMLASFYDILKPHSLMVFTVKLGKKEYISTLLGIIDLARKNGFEYVRLKSIDKKDPTIRKQAAYKNTLSNEMIIVFEKLLPEECYWYIRSRNYEFETIKTAYGLITKGRDNVTVSRVVKEIKDKIFREFAYNATDEDISRIHSIINANFIVESDTSFVRPDSKRLYLDVEESGEDISEKIQEYVPVFIESLLSEKEEFTLDDLYFEIADKLCTENPETINRFFENSSYSDSIKRIISEYCETSDKVYVRKLYSDAVSGESVDISSLSGTDFELLIKELLKEMGYEYAEKTGGSGDMGVDVIARRKDKYGNYEKYLFQCKRWKKNVGSIPMQRLYAERDRRKYDYAVCVTTSDFTKDGKKVGKEQNIEMWNGERVIRELNKYFPGKYYNRI